MAVNNFLPLIKATDKGTGCCPIFHPEQWHDLLFDFSKYHFIRAVTRSFFYIPLNMSSVMRKAQAAIDKAQQRDEERYLMLSEDISLFKCTHDILVKGPVPGYPSQSISGQWYARVFDGGYRDLPNWMQQLQFEAKKRGYILKRVMAFYTTCPECAKTYGHNYVVLFGLI